MTACPSAPVIFWLHPSIKCTCGQEHLAPRRGLGLWVGRGPLGSRQGRKAQPDAASALGRPGQLGRAGPLLVSGVSGAPTGGLTAQTSPCWGQLHQDVSGPSRQNLGSTLGCSPYACAARRGRGVCVPPPEVLHLWVCSGGGGRLLCWRRAAGVGGQKDVPRVSDKAVGTSALFRSATPWSWAPSLRAFGCPSW